jgi:hypothetical protein
MTKRRVWKQKMKTPPLDCRKSKRNPAERHNSIQMEMEPHVDNNITPFIYYSRMAGLPCILEQQGAPKHKLQRDVAFCMPRLERPGKLQFQDLLQWSDNNALDENDCLWRARHLNFYLAK